MEKYIYLTINSENEIFFIQVFTNFCDAMKEYKRDLEFDKRNICKYSYKWIALKLIKQ